MNAVTPRCAVHGDVELPIDAVYLRRRLTVPGSGLTVMAVVAICEGHLIRKAVSPHSVAALRAVGVRELDDATWALMVRLASPSDTAIADLMLTEVQDVAALRARFAVQAGRHLYGAVGTDRRDRVADVALAFADRLRALKGGAR
jgi:hypothetical protein